MSYAQIGKVTAAGMIGNMLEWYDFAIYGYFAAQIGRHFFPQEDTIIATTEKVSGARRPKLSPICPTMTPPIGRIRYPTAGLGD